MNKENDNFQSEINEKIAEAIKAKEENAARIDHKMQNTAWIKVNQILKFVLIFAIFVIFVAVVIAIFTSGKF